MTVQREHSFQSVTDRFLDRVVLPPCFITGIDHASQTTENARARARGRGIKAGVGDIYCAQRSGSSLWLELKWGGNKPSDAQVAVRTALWGCGIPCEFCWTIHDVLAALRAAGFRLHANADNLAIEYQARAEAAVRAAEAKAAKPRSAGKPRRRAPTIAQVRRAEAARRLPI